MSPLSPTESETDKNLNQFPSAAITPLDGTNNMDVSNRDLYLRCEM